MGMDIDEPGDHQPILGADRLPRIRLAQRWGDFDDLATGNRNIHLAAHAATGVDYISATDHQIIFHPTFLRLLLAATPGCRPEHISHRRMARAGGVRGRDHRGFGRYTSATGKLKITGPGSNAAACLSGGTHSPR
jgi:hypothetical protein